MSRSLSLVPLRRLHSLIRFLRQHIFIRFQENRKKQHDEKSKTVNKFLKLKAIEWFGFFRLGAAALEWYGKGEEGARNFATRNIPPFITAIKRAEHPISSSETAEGEKEQALMKRFRFSDGLTQFFVYYCVENCEKCRAMREKIRLHNSHSGEGEKSIEWPDSVRVDPHDVTPIDHNPMMGTFVNQNRNTHSMIQFFYTSLNWFFN